MSFNSNETREKKLVISGLDNAGKTSFLIALRKKYNFYEKVKALKPTIKIDYSSFDFMNRWIINFWDMGGQAKYRKIYVNNPIYFTDTDYLYYFIDIQDELKIEESVHYLHELLRIYREMGYSREIIVCFHKYDPKLRKKDEFSDRIEMIKNLVLTQNKDLKFWFFETSYYDISSLSRAISYSLNKLLNLEQLNTKVENIVREFGCNYAILYNNDGLIISDYYVEALETMDARDFEELISNKISDDLEFFQRLADNKVDIEERLSLVGDNMEYVKKYGVEIENGVNIFYLGISVPLKRIDKMKEELETIKVDLKSTFS